MFTKSLELISSVRFGVTLLILLAVLCFIGMIIMQQNVDGFDRYFAALTPGQRFVFGSLGLFDIYHAWYFNALLAVLSLNIVLTSIDRFPKTWAVISKPKITVPLRWLREQTQHAEYEVTGDREATLAKLTDALRSHGWRRLRTAEKAGRSYIFAESGVWNRLGAYPVHVALLTIFLGGFLTAQFGSTGSLTLSPGQTTDLIREIVVNLDKANEVTKRLPFEVTCTDIQQKLIRKEGSIDATNTIDWITTFTITDETGTHQGLAQMNKPFDYRGYRFFQAGFAPVGRARNITVNAKSETTGATEIITIPRGGSANLADGTKVDFTEFRGNFSLGPDDPNEDTSDYPNPGAILHVTPPNGERMLAYAFGGRMANVPVASKPVAGYAFQLDDFEKVSEQHILSVQRDPGANVVYIGFALLCFTLVAVFFFSHQRVWAVVEPADQGTNKVILAGNTNRNQGALDEKFRRFVEKWEASS